MLPHLVSLKKLSKPSVLDAFLYLRKLLLQVRTVIALDTFTLTVLPLEEVFIRVAIVTTLQVTEAVIMQAVEELAVAVAVTKQYKIRFARLILKRVKSKDLTLFSHCFNFFIHPPTAPSFTTL